MTDYDLLFKDMVDSAKKDIGSVSSLSMCKMMRNENGDGIKVMYKEDSTLPGWLPRPVLPHFRSAAWYRHFTGRTTYRPHEVLESFPRKVLKRVDGITHRWPEWVYKVKHANNEVHWYNIPVDSLPIPKFDEDLLERVNMAQPQEFRGKLRLRRNQERLRQRIDSLLTKRDKNTEEVKRSWDDFFSRLPKEDDLDRPEEHPNILAQLAKDHGHHMGKTRFE